MDESGGGGSFATPPWRQGARPYNPPMTSVDAFATPPSGRRLRRPHRRLLALALVLCGGAPAGAAAESAWASVPASASWPSPVRTRASNLAQVAAKAPALAAAPAISVTDDSGATVRLPAPARRVVSLAPHITELIFAAGGGATLVGAGDYSDFPPAATHVPRIGDSQALDLERIAALRPDLIVAWADGNPRQQLDQLRALGIPVFLSAPRSLDAIAADLRALGRLLGTAGIADPAARSFRAALASLRQRYADRPPVKVFYQVWDRPLMTLNGTHVVSDVIRLCGGRNVFASLPALVPTVSTEAVLAADPEAIFAAVPAAMARDGTPAALTMWRAWLALTAVARGNLFGLDGDTITRPTPRIALGAARLCEDLEKARRRRPTGRAPDGPRGTAADGPRGATADGPTGAAADRPRGRAGDGP